MSKEEILLNKKLITLLQEYPNAKIYPCTNYEVVGEDWGYWLGDIKKVYYGKIWFYNKMFYLDEDILMEQIEEIEDINYEEVKDSIKIKEGIIIVIDS